MKKLFSFIALSGMIASAQCTKTATGFGNQTSPGYDIKGTVEVILNTNNTISVKLGTNFTTAGGPDVRIFLLDKGTLTKTQLQNRTTAFGRPKIDMTDSAIRTSLGPIQTFTKPIPAGFDVTKIETVYFTCEDINMFWDFGSFTEFTTTNCSVLDNNVYETENTSVLYPTFVENDLNINLNNQAVSYKVYNSIGSLVAEKNNSYVNTIDFSGFNSGVYFVELSNNETTYKRKIVKQ